MDLETKKRMGEEKEKSSSQYEIPEWKDYTKDY